MCVRKRERKRIPNMICRIEKKMREFESLEKDFPKNYIKINSRGSH